MILFLYEGDVYTQVKKYIIPFIKTKYKNAIGLYKSPECSKGGWGGSISSDKSLIRRGDITNDITKISNSNVAEYLSQKKS